MNTCSLQNAIDKLLKSNLDLLFVANILIFINGKTSQICYFIDAKNIL